ncbi:MAG TPA: polymer-forming cytoskeletal protein [Anaerolineales bacterium]|nr:polymer-forming cytoskeletal protein [Anaerolineales bacterium]
MKHTLFIMVLLVLLLAFALPDVALAQYGTEDKIVLGGTFALESGETLDADLIVFGSSVTLEENSTVSGDVVVFGGSLFSGGTVEGSLVSIGGNQTINGTVQGSALILGGSVLIDEQAVIEGDLTSIGGSVQLDAGARIEGEMVNGFQIPPISLFGGGEQPNGPDFGVRLSPIWAGMWFLFRLFLWAALAALVTLFVPNPTNRIARTIVEQPLLSGGVGLITAIVAPLVLVVLAITIILIPVSLLGGLALVIAWFFGRIALGMEIGRRIGQMFNREWPYGLAAGVGTFALALVVDGAGELIPCVGWLLPFLVGVLGLGAVILTRFGTQTYPPYQSVGIYTAPPGPPAPVLAQSSTPESLSVEESPINPET